MNATSSGDAERGQALDDGRLDHLERGASDERRQEIDGDPTVGDVDAVDDPEIDDRDDRDLRVGHVGEGGHDVAPRVGAVRLDHHAATGSSRRTVVNSFHSQRNGSPWRVRPSPSSAAAASAGRGRRTSA